MSLRYEQNASTGTQYSRDKKFMLKVKTLSVSFSALNSCRVCDNDLAYDSSYTHNQL